MTELDEWNHDHTADDDAAIDQAVGAKSENSAPAGPSLYCTSLPDWMERVFLPTFRRRVDGRTTFWSARWWEHAEAVVRLEALWRSWEHLRLDPATGMSVWLRDHLDPHLAVLLSEDGPFAGQRDDTNNRGEPLPSVPPPGGLFPLEG